MRTTIDALLTGTVRGFTLEGDTSAIAKQSVDGPRRIGFLGIEGDEQADLANHGGRDKAIHHYPRDHYAGWQGLLGDLPRLAAAGAFGENISTSGWNETDVCLGDRFRLGTALVEIAQGRQPCWKQSHHLSTNAVVKAMVATARTGWYYRVIEEGEVAAGDAIALVERPLPDWSVWRMFRLLIGGGHRGEQAALHDLSTIALLADGWRDRAARLAGA